MFIPGEDILNTSSGIRRTAICEHTPRLLPAHSIPCTVALLASFQLLPCVNLMHSLQCSADYRPPHLLLGIYTGIC